MFEVSWGELFVVTGLGFALIGKQDLPKAAGFVGNRIGRIVGLLQGARARADTFAQQSELKQLHSELRAGLRELDAVKSEMAVAMSSRNAPGFSMNRPTTLQSQPARPKFETSGTMSKPTEAPTATANQGEISNAPMQSIATSSSSSVEQIPAGPSLRNLPPKHQTVAAVAEEEWEKQGIGFRSRAERGVGLGYHDDQANDPLNSGSSILNNIIQQNLIFDQYDRVVQEQDSILQSKMDDIQNRRGQKKGNKNEEEGAAGSESDENGSKKK